MNLKGKDNDKKRKIRLKEGPEVTVPSSMRRFIGPFLATLGILYCSGILVFAGETGVGVSQEVFPTLSTL